MSRQSKIPTEVREPRGAPRVGRCRRARIGDGSRSSRWRRRWDSTPETLRAWVKQFEIDNGKAPGLTSDERARLKQLERENFELRRANEILKSASAFFAAELDRPHKR